ISILVKKIVLIKQRIQAAQDRQKSYADLKWKLMEFEVGDRIMLKEFTLTIGSNLWKSPLKSWNGRSNDESEAGYHWLKFAGTLGEVPSLLGNVKIRSERNTHISSQTRLRRPRQGLKL
nr:reverse transcriptase domain-containing protein [Tanacetum cinerariifolium]